jgi:hypothetical protein
MIATPSANPFAAAQGFNVNVGGGTPPYTYTPRPRPPNPPGVTVDENHVSVPGNTPSGTTVIIDVMDSSTPPQQTMCSAATS